MAKYNVKIGHDFAVDGFEIEDLDAVERLVAIAERRHMARRRDKLANIVLGTILAALTGAALRGCVDGTFNELSAIWGYCAPFLGLALYPILEKGMPATNGKNAGKYIGDEAGPDGHAA